MSKKEKIEPDKLEKIFGGTRKSTYTVRQQKN